MSHNTARHFAAVTEPKGLEALGRWCHRRRRTVLVVWIAALAVVAAGSATFGSQLSNAFNVPGAESQRAFDILYTRFPEQAGFAADVVFRSDWTLEDPVVASRVGSLVADVRGIDGVVEVVTPFEPEGAFQVAPDRRTGFARVRFDRPAFEVRSETVEAILAAVERSRAEGFQVEVGGPAIQFAAQTDPGRSEQIGFLAAGAVLFVTFGSIVAMGLPIVTALFGLGIALVGLPLLAHVFPVPTFGLSLASMIGIGVGIDYALFILTRYRSSLGAGADSEHACGHALATAGRAVMFAGVVVCVAMAGLFVVGIPMVQGMAVAAITAVALAMIASVTLVPALLGFAGRAIDRFSIPQLNRRSPADGSRWFRWSRLIQRHPWPAAVGAFVLLVVLTLPALSMRLGIADAGSNSPATTTRKAFDIIADAFGPGFNGPLLLAADISDPADVGAMERVADAVRRQPGVALVGAPRLNQSGDAAVIFVVPETAPQAQATTRLIRDLRQHVLPAAVGGDEPAVAVGGATATYNDLTDLLSRRLPIFVAVVIGLSFLLLIAVFRSLLVAAKAAVLNLLSIGGAFGVIVAVFQWGWFAEWLGVDRTGPIQSFVPMMLFAIVFGLSMDYEVFLISRVREEYLRTGDNSTAVADGVATTARVITAAAAIMVTVFGSGLFSDDALLKLFGLGLAVAIFLDAAVVRTVLVPATMELLGSRNWWLPAWLDRLIPAVNIERQNAPTAATDVPVVPSAAGR